MNERLKLGVAGMLLNGHLWVLTGTLRPGLILRGKKAILLAPDKHFAL